MSCLFEGSVKFKQACSCCPALSNLMFYFPSYYIKAVLESPLQNSTHTWQTKIFVWLLPVLWVIGWRPGEEEFMCPGKNTLSIYQKGPTVLTVHEESLLVGVIMVSSFMPHWPPWTPGCVWDATRLWRTWTCALKSDFVGWRVCLLCVCFVHSSCAWTWPMSEWGCTSPRYYSSRSRLSVYRRGSPWRPPGPPATSQLLWTSFSRYCKLLVCTSPVLFGLSWRKTTLWAQQLTRQSCPPLLPSPVWHSVCNMPSR